jgi:chorismate mutase/prephenate dehydratase
MTLDALRRDIDAIDAQIIELLDRRAALAHAVGRAKRDAGLPMHDPARERALIERLELALKAKEDPSFPPQAVRSVFREVISACLSVEESLSIAFLGPAGTFTHMAAQAEFGLAASYAEAATVAAVFDAVERQRATYGVVPIENPR